ncbi:MAG: ATP-dependent DNA helicase [Steroidobacteraceae bacterium]
MLVDEAHNLLERARQMYTAVLDPIAFASARRVAPAGLGRAFARLAQAWAELEAGLVTDYQATDEPADSLLAAVKGLAGALAEHLGTTLEAPDPDLQRFAFDARFFSRLCEQAGPHAMFDITRAGPSSPEAPLTRLALRNVIPAPHLAPRFAAARACVLFSATLSPQGFYRDTLGLPADCDTLEVGSPFDPGQLEVRISSRISTRWRDRPTSVRPIVELMARQFRKLPGNYLAFFSSFEYLQRVLAEFRARHPAVAVWEQRPRMPGPERRDFLARFTADSRGIGFAVLGGAFAEGIDLPNERLIGAFIATLGLPPVTPMNEEISRRLGQAFDAAFEYTYLYPGLQKVVQAAGRVIRTPTDRGIIHLIDDRYRRAEVKALLPRWWRLDA